MVTSQQLKDYAKPKIEAGNYNWTIYEKQIQKESGWKHYDSNGEVLTSYTGSSKGVGQLNQSFYPESIWRDPYTNLDASITTAINYLTRFKTYPKALAAYNWGPGNVGGYKDSDGHVHPAWDGTRSWKCPVGLPACQTAQRDNYLDSILGPDWDTQKPAPGAPTVPQFSVGSGLLALMTEREDSPATDEMYYKNATGKDQYSEALGQSGTRYVYIFSTNKSYSFLPD